MLQNNTFSLISVQNRVIFKLCNTTPPKPYNILNNVLFPDVVLSLTCIYVLVRHFCETSNWGGNKVHGFYRNTGIALEFYGITTATTLKFVERLGFFSQEGNPTVRNFELTKIRAEFKLTKNAFSKRRKPTIKTQTLFAFIFGQK